MKKKVLLPWDYKSLWEGCILLTIAHAISSANSPEFSYEHSWDEISYNAQDSSGTIGTITFHEGCCVGAVRSDYSPRRYEKVVEAANYLTGAEPEIFDLAQRETFQYLLDDVNGKTKPVITAAFWGDENGIYAVEDEHVLSENGIQLFRIQLMEFADAIEAVREQYDDLNNRQIDLLISLYKKAIDTPEGKIKLTNEEVNIINAADIDGINASKELFAGVGIEWP